MTLHITSIEGPYVPYKSFGNIESVVAQVCEVDMDHFRGTSRKAHIAKSRQILMYVFYRYTDLSLPRIGKRLGGRDHSTIYHGVHRVEEMIANDPLYSELVRQSVQLLRQKGYINYDAKPDPSRLTPI